MRPLEASGRYRAISPTPDAPTSGLPQDGR